MTLAYKESVEKYMGGGGGDNILAIYSTLS